MSHLQPLRDHLVRLLRGGQAYDTLEAIVAAVPENQRGLVPLGAEQSAWAILEHMRITQRDILDFSRNEDGHYRELDWPAQYWPAGPEPPDGGAWDGAVQSYLADRRALEELALDDQRDLFALFPWGSGQTLLRELMLAAEHAAYHLGQIVIVQRILSA
jgi:hypothetical protein